NATQYVWDRTAANYFILGSTLESTKQPMENARVWNAYAGQTRADTEGAIAQPSVVARVLDDGTSQIYRYSRNAIGKPTQITDPTNRITYYAYTANNIDLL